MPSPSSDPAFLFTPQNSASPTGLPPSSDEVPSSESNPQTTPRTRQKSSFFIEPPVLSASQKQQYKKVPEELKEGATFDRDDIEAVVGEHREGTDLYYFVRFKDGLAHKVRITLKLYAALTFECSFSFLLVTSGPCILTWPMTTVSPHFHDTHNAHLLSISIQISRNVTDCSRNLTHPLARCTRILASRSP